MGSGIHLGGALARCKLPASDCWVPRHRAVALPWWRRPSGGTDVAEPPPAWAQSREPERGSGTTAGCRTGCCLEPRGTTQWGRGELPRHWLVVVVLLADVGAVLGEHGTPAVHSTCQACHTGPAEVVGHTERS